MLHAILLAMLLSPEQEIRNVLIKQNADWNRGDVKAFMEGYEKIPDLMFVGASTSRGYDALLANYIKRYPTPEAMGSLKFETVEVRMLGAAHACVLGKWNLTRTAEGGGDAGGLLQ